MNADKPVLRRGFDKVERAVGKPLEDVVASPTYVDVMLFGRQVQRAISGAVVRVVGGAVGTVLRAANVPTAADIQRLSRQLTELTTEVRTLTVTQQETQRRARARAPKKPADAD